MTKIRVILYLLITAIILALLNQYIASTEMYGGKTAQIDSNFAELYRREQEQMADRDILLVIGNSYVAASFDADSNGDNTLLFRVAGMPMVDMVGIIENLPNDTVVDTVLVGLGYNYASPVGGTSSGYARHFTSNQLRRAWASLPLVRGRSIASTALKEDVKCLLAKFVEVRCAKTGNDELGVAQGNGDGRTSVDPIQHLEVIRESVQRRYDEYVPFTSHLSENFQEYLLRMKEACSSKDVRLYAFTAPIYHELRERLVQSTLEDFRASIHLVGIEYVDLNTVFPDWDATMFSDATHVEKGMASKQITEYLLNAIEGEAVY